MNILTALQTSPAFFYTFVAVFSLAIGSFLNVVIHRVPRMMHHSWRGQCADYLKDHGIKPPEEINNQRDGPPYNLFVPRSNCPSCGHHIAAIENIPVISYIMLRGKCAKCRTSISPRYPGVELLTAVLSCLVAWHFGPSIQTLCALPFTWALIALSFIDFDEKLLPDDITLPFLWMGLFINLFNVYTTPQAAIIGAIAGYLILWSVYWSFKLLTGKEGMGYGDFKLLAMLGAWMGWKMLPVIVLLSSLVGAIIGIALIVLRGRDKNIPIPFGPYLAIAGWIALLWGDAIIKSYLQFANLR